MAPSERRVYVNKSVTQEIRLPETKPARRASDNVEPRFRESVRVSEHLPIGEGASSHVSLCLDTATSKELVVLYMHGFASSQSGSKAAFFRQRFQALDLAFCSFDFRGHGDSGGSMRELTLTRNLADARRAHAYLREQGYRRLLLCGSSMGAASALWYAALHPEDVAGTVSISPALEIDRSLLARIGREGAERWQRDGTVILQHPLGPQELGWDLIEDLRSYHLKRLKASYSAPALIFQGKHDDSVDWSTVMDFATGCAFEGIELHLIADGDHRLADHLDHLWRLTASFLEAREIV